MIKRTDLVWFCGLIFAVGCESIPVASRPIHHPAVVSAVAPASVSGVRNGSVNSVEKSDAEIVPINHNELTQAVANEAPLLERLPKAASAPAESTAVVDQASGISLATIEQLASANNPTLIQARSHVDGTLGKALQAGLWPNPILGYQAEKIGSQGTAGEFQGGFIRQEIVTAQKQKLSREKYLARAKAAEFVALAQQFRVVNDIRRQYWHAVGAGRLLSIEEQMLKNAEDRLVTTQEMFNIGQANTVQVRQARMRAQRAKLDLQNAANHYDQERRELSAFAAADIPVGPLADNLDQTTVPLTWESSLAYIIAESPEVCEARTKLQSDQITVEREQRQPIPNIFVQAGPGYDFTENRTVANAQLYFQVPTWNRNQGTIQQAQSDLFRQQAEIRRIELRLGRDLAMPFKKYQSALQHVDAYRSEILPEAEKAYKDGLDAYKQQRGTWHTVLDLQSELYQRQSEYVKNLVAMRDAQTLIEGFLLTGGLDAPPNPTPVGHIDATPQPR